MAKKKPSALDALTRHDEEERRLASLRDALRQAAALELGIIVLDAGGGALGSEGLRQAIRHALDNPAPQRRPVAAGAPKSGGTGGGDDRA